AAANVRPVAGPGCEALRELLRFLARERIASVLVVTPEGPELRSWYAPENLARVDAFLAGLARELAVPLVNAREWIAGAERFQDSHHLDPEGAAAFTDRLEREVLEPALAKGER